ncbi:MAG: hypothetical protein JO280_08550 [Mycobacteriaceae bacterium]|nr:hypothetical protein [Mycobacteriaceae bacterium]
MISAVRGAVAAAATAAVALACAGAANADNSNNNNNNNDVTNIGGSSATDSSANENVMWPPTDLSWPPQQILNAGEGGNDNGNDNAKSNNKTPATPIVLPVGQSAPAATAAPSTSEAPTPIVPVATP